MIDGRGTIWPHESEGEEEGGEQFNQLHRWSGGQLTGRSQTDWGKGAKKRKKKVVGQETQVLSRIRLTTERGLCVPEE